MGKRWDHDRCTPNSGNYDISLHSSGTGHVYVDGVKADLTTRGCEAITDKEKMKLQKD